jgi:hypothetical protein
MQELAYRVGICELQRLDSTERAALYKTLVGIPCMKDGYGIVRMIDTRTSFAKSNEMQNVESAAHKSLRKRRC